MMVLAKIRKEILALIIISGLISSSCLALNSVTVWPMPPGEAESGDYKVEVGGKSAFVSTAPVLRGLPASFSSFEFSGTVQVRITCSEKINSFKILPSSLGLEATVEGRQLIFSLNQPANLTIELNGSLDHNLHLFANPPDKNRPRATDPNVIYFGPGLHEVSTIRPRTGQTIYLAPGAVVRAVIPADEEPVEVIQRNGVEEKIYSPFIEAGGVKNVTIRGRGILDLSRLPWHSRKAIWFDGSANILIAGITLLDAPDWAVVMHQCTNVTVRNIKQISWRENSDGVDICNSQSVLVENCFFRVNDDAVSVKTISPPPALKSANILVQNCVIWNERARALGITSETLANIYAVTFQNCDIIHDLSEGGDCAALAILVSDSGTITNINFRDIRVEDCRTKLIRCWIGDDGWSQDNRRGKIKQVTFDNISVSGNLPVSELLGYDASHLISDVTLSMQVNGQMITDLNDANFEINDYVNNVNLVDFN